jgi:hypothetical protein
VVTLTWAVASALTARRNTKVHADERRDEEVIAHGSIRIGYEPIETLRSYRKGFGTRGGGYWRQRRKNTNLSNTSCDDTFAATLVVPQKRIRILAGGQNAGKQIQMIYSEEREDSKCKALHHVGSFSTHG